MNSRQKIEAVIAAHKKGIEPPAEAQLGAIIACAPEMTQEKQEHLGFLGRSKPRDQETKRILGACSTQVALNESYMAKKCTPTGEASVLFDRYGDVMGVVDQHPAFRKATTPIDQGGWGLFPQALTNACKQHSTDGDLGTGVLKVLEAIRYTANYRAARNKAAFFWAVLRNGTRKEA